MKKKSLSEHTNKFIQNKLAKKIIIGNYINNLLVLNWETARFGQVFNMLHKKAIVDALSTVIHLL